MSESTTEPTDAPEASQEQGNPDAAAANLGDAGKQALDRMKAERNEAKKQAAEMQKQLDALNAEKMSDLERAQDAAKKAEEAAAKATVEALRFRVAAKHGISDEDAELFLNGADVETLERQAARLMERAPISPRPDPSQGGKGEPPALNSNALEQALKTKLGIA